MLDRKCLAALILVVVSAIFPEHTDCFLLALVSDCTCFGQKKRTEIFLSPEHIYQGKRFC